jgi:hypothetical protein
MKLKRLEIGSSLRRTVLKTIVRRKNFQLTILVYVSSAKPFPSDSHTVNQGCESSWLMETSYLNEEDRCSMKYSLSLVVKGSEFCYINICLKKGSEPLEETSLSCPLRTQSVGKLVRGSCRVGRVVSLPTFIRYIAS